MSLIKLNIVMKGNFLIRTSLHQWAEKVSVDLRKKIKKHGDSFENTTAIISGYITGVQIGIMMEAGFSHLSKKKAERRSEKLLSQTGLIAVIEVQAQCIFFILKGKKIPKKIQKEFFHAQKRFIKKSLGPEEYEKIRECAKDKNKLLQFFYEDELQRKDARMSYLSNLERDLQGALAEKQVPDFIFAFFQKIFL